ncbi:MAG: hypothetical protein ACRYG4_26165 [Janthinobacterium lividum]
MTPATKAALSAGSALLFGAVEVDLPGYTLRLLDGAATLVIGGNVFTASDPIYGAISALHDLADGAGDEAPSYSIDFLPPSDTAAATLASAAMQGSAVKFYLGAVDRVTGLVIPDPEVIVLAELDVPTLTWDATSRLLTWTVTSVFERFFDVEEGQRLSDSFHQYVWPGELGLQFVTGVTQPVYWGLAAPSVVAVSIGGSRSSDRQYEQLQ